MVVLATVLSRYVAIIYVTAHGVFPVVVDVYIAVQDVAVILSVHRGCVLVPSILAEVVSVMIIIIVIFNRYCYHYVIFILC